MPLPSTYTPIATNTLSSATNSITFSNIPQNYTDLVVVGNFGIASSQYPYIRFNSDSGSNYSTTDIYGNGSNAASSRESNGTKIWISLDVPSSTTIASNFIVNVQNYSNSTTYKTVLCRDNNAASGTTATVGLWRNTNAITSVTIGGFGGGSDANLASGSTFTLYGIKAAS